MPPQWSGCQNGSKKRSPSLLPMPSRRKQWALCVDGGSIGMAFPASSGLVAQQASSAHLTFVIHPSWCGVGMRATSIELINW
mmetsp:Transcript_4716/g.6965  ORF Transcript_4716/g.6965 Transcript_4716/m.6965 type:complete len:82 (+) Transcript_4716:186-431(+)